MVKNPSKTPVVPAEGETISLKDGQLIVPDYPVVPFIEGDGIGPDIWRATRMVVDAAVERSYDTDRKVCWTQIYAGEKLAGAVRRVDPAGDLRRDPPFPRGHQGAPDDARRRRDAQRQRGPAPGAGPLRLRAARLLDPGRALPRQGAAEAGRGGLPREHRGRLRRHRVRRPARDEARKLAKYLARTLKAKVREGSAIGIKPISRECTRRLMRMAIQRGPAGAPPQHHHRPQGQHHEVHGGRVPRLGLRAGRGRVPRADRDREAALRRAQRRRRRPAGWSSRTASPTPCSSRCCCGRPSTTCWSART